MNRSIFWRLVWKEYRLQRALWIAIAVLTLLLQAIVAWMSTRAADRADWLFGLALTLSACYALGCGAVLFAAERETGTFEFQRAIPASPPRLFAGKVFYALASTLALVLVLLLSAAALSRWQLPDAATQAGLWATMGLGAWEALAWGVFFSLRSSRPLLAAILAVAVASTLVHFIAWCIAPSEMQMRYGPTVPYRLGVLALVALADYRLGLRWPSAGSEVSLLGRLAPWPRKRADKPVTAAIACRPPRSMTFGRLLWQQWRQSRAMMAALGLLAVAFGSLMSWKAEISGIGASDSPEATTILASLLASLLGCVVFLGDQTRRQFRFLAEHGARPGPVWLSRQLMWLAALVLWVAAVTSLVVLFRGRDPYWLFRNGYVGNPGQAGWWLLVLGRLRPVNLIGWTFMAYAAGQLCSLFFRSGILAAVFGVLLAGLLCGWAWLMALLEINRLWSVAPIPFALLLATRLRIGDWMLQRNRLWGWLRVGLVVALPAVAILAAIPGARLSAVPLPGAGYPVPYAVRDWTDEERATEATYERACRLYQDAERFMPEEQQGKSDWSRPRLNGPPRAWELAWLKANRECLALTLEASRRPVSDDPRPIRGQYRSGVSRSYWNLPGLLTGAARVAQIEGRLDEAMECYLAAFRVSRHEAVYHAGHLGLGEFFYDDLCAWVARPGQTSQRVATMFREVTKVTDHPPSRASEISAEDQYVRDLIDGDPTALSRTKLDPRDVVLIALWNDWLPWERERALRLLAHRTVRRLERCQEVEQAAQGETIHVPRERTRRLFFFDLPDRPWPKAIALNGYLSPPPRRLGNDLADEKAAFLRQETSRRVVRLMLAIEAWRLEKGRFPESLDVLVGPYLDRVPADPATGRAFGYYPEGCAFPIECPWGGQNPIQAKTPLLTGSEVRISRGYPCGEDWRRFYKSAEDAKYEPEHAVMWFADPVFPLPVPQEKSPAAPK